MDMQKLKTEGKVYVPYPSHLRVAMREAMERWEAFCALPVETKLLLGYTPDESQSGNGYECKMEKGKTLDLKENLHFRFSWYEEGLQRARNTAPEAQALMESLRVLPELIKPSLLEFAQAVEQTFGIRGFVDDVESSVPKLIIRLLHYFGDVELDEVIAKPHIDKGGFTLHLWESAGGVEQLSFDKKDWRPIPVSHDEALFFPSSGMQHLLRNEVKALCHRVVATPESARFGRYSAVGFVDFRGNASYNKEKNGRLQDWPPGFNYDMPWEEFRKLFYVR
jgi:isopenicillin N synthase-like dioxygenase